MYRVGVEEPTTWFQPKRWWTYSWRRKAHLTRPLAQEPVVREPLRSWNKKRAFTEEAFEQLPIGVLWSKGRDVSPWPHCQCVIAMFAMRFKRGSTDDCRPKGTHSEACVYKD